MVEDPGRDPDSAANLKSFVAVLWQKLESSTALPASRFRCGSSRKRTLTVCSLRQRPRQASALGG